MHETFQLYWDEITAWVAFVSVLLSGPVAAWALTIKKEPISALAWCLVILFLPFVGILLFLLLGYQQVQRPLARKARHKREYRSRSGNGAEATETTAASAAPPVWESVAQLARRFDAYPATTGNQVTFYYDGEPAFAAKLEAIRAARHHIHLEYFIFQPDAIGHLFLQTLVDKVREGVEVRLVYDAMGSRRLHRWTLRPLRQAGGQVRSFLPIDPLRRRIQVNLRNHRKILVVDGQVAFTGGLNIGDEYLGRNPRFGYWRDTHMRIEGLAVHSLQRVFIEDWDFASGEHLAGERYFPPWSAERVARSAELDARSGERGLQSAECGSVGEAQSSQLAEGAPSRSALHAPRFTSMSPPLSCPVQVIQSGPDQALKSIREIYFAAILRAKKRLWIASPYFVPDAALFDAIRLAGYQGVDVRLLCQFYPDKWIAYYAARYYWDDVLAAGVKIYQYTRGMMHSKVILVDDEWASVGTANFDNRSMHLNFEVNCLLYAPEAVADLEAAFLRDLTYSLELTPEVFDRRPFGSRMIENVSRLLSPVL